MRIRRLLSFLLFLFLFQSLQAQPMKPADPTLREQLIKYTADNHLQTGNMYMYWDSVNKKPIRFQAGSFLVIDERAEAPLGAPAKIKGSAGSANLLPNFHLVSDLDTSYSSSSSVSTSAYGDTRPSFAVLNGVAYFTADDGIHGRELWRSDGTAAGTYLFRDVVAGAAGSSPYNLYASSKRLYFSTYYSSIGKQAYSTDGSASDLDSLFLPGNTFYTLPTYFCEVGDTVYFTTRSSAVQLWKTDGTQKGTLLVKAFTDDNLDELRNLTALDGVLYFGSYSYNTNKSLLMRSDGTAAGTYVIKSFTNNANVFALFNSPTHLTACNHKLYFTISDSTNTNTLWASDGTTGGTSYVPGYNGVSLIYDDFASLSQDPLVVSQNVLYFSGYTPATGWEMYKYDANTASGITLVKDITPGTGGYTTEEYNIAEAVGTVYFSYADAAGVSQLYSTGGTAATTTLVKNFSNTTMLGSFYGLNTRLYFTESEGNTNSEPWVSDGTAAGTLRLADVYPGTGGSSPAFYTALNNSTIVFSAYDASHANELFISNGSGAQLVTDINTTTTESSNPYGTIPYGDGVLTAAYTYDKGLELYKANSSGESLVQDLLTGQPGSNPSGFIAKNNAVYFSAFTNNYNTTSCIYRTDGTAAGTVKMTPDLNGRIQAMAVTDDLTIFYFLRSSNQNQLWKTDGTTNTLLGTYYDLRVYYDNITNTYSNLRTIGNTIYFSAYTNNAGNELYKSDGTIAGTQLVKDIYPGPYASILSYLTVYNQQLYFSAYDGTEYAIWKSDGTSAGTTKLVSVSTDGLTVSGGFLYFSGYNSTYGSELWKTDGSSAGTVLVKDIVPGSESSSPENLIDVNGTLFFSANNNQLWKSDGTDAGTQLVSSLPSGLSGNFVSSANRLFFLLNNQLWVSDGTAGGTQAVSDETLNGVSIFAFIASGSRLFLNGGTYQYGYELYTGDASQVVLPVTLISFGVTLKGADVITQWQTSSEINTSYFTIQRSIDDIHFTDVGKVTAKGNGGTYLFTDANIANLVSAKTIYYRLQTIDKDGSTSLSKVVPIDLHLKDAIVLLLPNPVKDVLTIRVNNYTGKASISIYDLTGKNISSLQQSVQSGATIAIDAAALQAGVYIAKINLNSKIIEKKFVKE